MWLIFYICITSTIIFVLLSMNLSILQAYLLTITFVMGIYFLHAVINSRINSKLLNEDCDPEKYLNKIMKSKKVYRKKPKYLAMISINEAVANILMGKFYEARQILDNIDQSYLSEKNGTLLTYMIDYISCCFELGDIDTALSLYNTQLPILTPFNKNLKRSIKILIGERYFFEENYDKSYESLNQLLDIELNRRTYLGILYRLAQIDRIRGDMEKARKKYTKIAQYGNKLWIAKQAKDFLENKNEKENIL